MGHPLVALAASAIFLAGYVAISLSHRWDAAKEIFALILGAGLWFLIAATTKEPPAGALGELGSEILEIILFLAFAMTLVEIIAHYGFFDIVHERLYRRNLPDRKQLWALCGIAFVLSPVFDNLTTTIVAIQIARKFLRGRNLILASAGIVIAANAGGAFSPIGDVTTIMLWLEGKFTVLEIIGFTFLPALALAVASTWLIARKMRRDQNTPETKLEPRSPMHRAEKAVVAAALVSFALPIAASQMGLPPFLGLMLGLGFVLFLDLRARRERDSRLHIEMVLEKIDLASLFFFAGILFAVGALSHIGILEFASRKLFGGDPQTAGLIGGSVALGALSAVLDNIPLAAASMEIIRTSDPHIWTLLALTLGTGGSILVIGSAAGIVAMGQVKELTFAKYLRIATVPAVVGYLVAIAVWLGQYTLLA